MEGSVEVAYPYFRTLFGDGDIACATPTETSAAMTSPILVFLFFHKAIREELERLYTDALAVEKGEEKEFRSLHDRFEFLRVVYTQHSTAEDEVIFPALDSRVKNIAQTYSLEHKDESELFDKMLELLNSALKERFNASTKFRRDLICCTEAIQTTLCKHMSKEQEQVFPLLIQHLSFEEQAGLVWQFICSVPMNLMEEFLPWLASCLSQEECKEMIDCMHKVVPKEDLLRQVIFTWLEGASITGKGRETENIANGMNVSKAASGNGFLMEASTSQGRGGLVEQASMSQGCKLEGMGERPAVSCKRNIECLAAGPYNGTIKASERRLYSPIDVLLSWHNAIRKELIVFAEEAKRIQSSAAEYIPIFSERLQFLAEVCIFHSAAEDKVIFPAIGQKAKQCVSFSSEHLEEERHFNDIRRLLEGVQKERGLFISTDIYSQIYTHAELIVKTIQQHLVDEETKVFPLARAHCSIEEQQTLVYQSLRVMPLKLLERVLPWLVDSLNEEEAKNMLYNIHLAAPASDAALITLLLGWACKGRAEKSVVPARFSCFYSNMTGGCSAKRSCLNNECRSGCGVPSLSSSLERQREDDCATTEERSQKRPRYDKAGDKQELTSVNASQSETCRATMSCCVPNLGVGGSSLGFGAGTARRSLQSLPSNPLQSGYLGSRLFGLGSESGSPSACMALKPIDTIFQFHKAIRKDLKYLDDESAGLADCDDGFLRQFTRRFQILWGLYRAHSNAEDEIVFPALEAKETLRNVSHSYTIDHKHEEKLFKEIANVLYQLSVLHGCLCGQDPKGSLGVQGSQEGSIYTRDNLLLYKKSLAAKLQGMCNSVNVTLTQHVSREEVELWPLFCLHFTIEEQEKLVGQIIGITGAEVLQAMLPWVTTALSQEEQNILIYTWRQATRNTMFDKWLQAWWKWSPPESPQSSVSDDEIPESGTPGSLQLVADYLSKGRLESDEHKDNTVETPVCSPKEGSTQACMVNLVTDSKKEGELKGHGLKLLSCDRIPSGMETQKHAISEQVFEEKIEEESTKKFKRGWQDIFRMNEKELEAAVRKVSGDTSLDPRRKAYLMQNLMTSRWIVAQQHPSRTLMASASGEHEGISGRCASYVDSNQDAFGCEHYKRNCKIRAACCGVLVSCRFCHDKVSDHVMDRQATQEMMCMRCLEVQPVAQYCATPSCDGFCMAKSYCSICKLFDDRREVYHCPSCNLCRVGKGLGIDIFHCMTCNSCMSMLLLTSHKCRERGLESNCPVCHDFLFTSHTPVKTLLCGHFMHSACYRAYTYNNYTCPICSKSLGDMNVYFGMLDALLASEQLPDRQQDILCNDCEGKSRAPFHWLYHKCSKCGSYNTRAI